MVCYNRICITFYSIHWVSALQTVGDVCVQWVIGQDIGRMVLVAGGTNLFRGRRVVVNSPYLQTTTLVNTLFGANLYCGGEQPLHPTTNLVNTLFGARTINFLVRAL